MKNVILIGNGTMAIDCLEILSGHQSVCVRLVLYDPGYQGIGRSISRYCTRQGIPSFGAENINAPEIIARASEHHPDIIFNVNSFQIIKKELLTLPPGGVINFHNGPLPRYRGVNVCAWAIINGEKDYGVTWHYVDDGIDSGDILMQSFFPLSSDETLITLTLKCIREGVKNFSLLLANIIDGKTCRQQQIPGKATFYSSKDIPYNGQIDFNLPYYQLDRFVRGLYSHPVQDLFIHPKVNYKDNFFYLLSLAKVISQIEKGRKGRILDIGIDRIHVQAADSIIAITKVMNHHKQIISIEKLVRDCQIREGDFFNETH